jgi:hypothetical protein
LQWESLGTFVELAGGLTAQIRAKEMIYMWRLVSSGARRTCGRPCPVAFFILSRSAGLIVLVQACAWRINLYPAAP